jgi:hypothetical protein
MAVHPEVKVKFHNCGIDTHPAKVMSLIRLLRMHHGWKIFAAPALPWQPITARTPIGSG